jgi:hypothetical protein
MVVMEMVKELAGEEAFIAHPQRKSMARTFLLSSRVLNRFFGSVIWALLGAGVNSFSAKAVGHMQLSVSSSDP